MRKKNTKSRKMYGATADKFHEVKATPRGMKGVKPKKTLPPWRDVKDELK